MEYCEFTHFALGFDCNGAQEQKELHEFTRELGGEQKKLIGLAKERGEVICRCCSFVLMLFVN